MAAAASSTGACWRVVAWVIGLYVGQAYADLCQTHIAATSPLKLNPVAPTSDIRLTFLESNSWLWQVRGGPSAAG